MIRRRENRRTSRHGRHELSRLKAGPRVCWHGMGKTENLRLTLACWDYDRTRAIMENRVRFDGIDLTYLNLIVEETFFRQMRHHEFDVSEISFSSFLVSMFEEKPPFIGIPIFPSRSFRHSGIYINADAGIREPKDLIGKRIGCAEYQLTANVWIRGILNDEYGVAPSSYSTFIGGLEESGRVEKASVVAAAANTDRAHRRDADALGDARIGRDRRAVFATGAAHPLSGGPVGCAASSRIPRRPSVSTSSGRGFSRSCTSSRSVGTSTKHTAGLPSPCVKVSPTRSGWRTRISIRRLPSR